MTREDIEKTKTENTEAASTVARQLAFAGLGLVWILKPDKSGLEGIPTDLKGVLPWLCIGLCFDFVQYVWSSAGWWLYFLTENETIGNWAKRGAYVLFFLKLACICWGYILIALF